MSDTTRQDGLVATKITAERTADDRDREHETIIHVEYLDAYYGDEQALRDVSMAVPEKQVTALIGPSGCGKSTFLRCCNRMKDLVVAARTLYMLEHDNELIY